MAKETPPQRPTPDELLKKANKEIRGKLTVFLGAAAGVGKTYAMLEAAHERLAEGVDVRIGWIETHGRAETERLVAGVPRIAPKALRYRERELLEMDVDAILAEKPELVLVDELAHTNIPGSRHVRRFQDVEELLKAGIHVYTTLNIQHIESLNDVVARITGVVVRETVPDHVLEEADNIQLIDIPPEDLIKRLREGKVYVPGQAERALKKFFRPGNINALRELSLRFTASQVDQDLAEYMRYNQIIGPWPAAGRIMVCVSGSPFSGQLVRAARRLSAGVSAELLAVHVESLKTQQGQTEAERERIAKNLRLAEELGGKTMTVVGEDFVDEVLEVARRQNVTAIVIGKPRHGRWRELLYGSLVDKLIRSSGEINVYVIQPGTEEKISGRSRPRPVEGQGEPWFHYAGGLAMAAVVTAVCWQFNKQLEIVNIALLYLLPVLLTAIWWGRWSSHVTAIVSVLTFDFLFVPPFFAFSVSDIRYLWSFVIFLFVSFVIGGRTDVLRQEAKTARQRERSVRSLLEFSREISAVTDGGQIAKKLADYIGETLLCSTVVLLPDNGGRLFVRGGYHPEAPTDSGEEGEFPEAEYAVAVWSFENAETAGRFTETLPGAKYLYIPLTTNGNTSGVFGIRLSGKQLIPRERALIDAWTGLAAVALERGKLAEQARQATLLVESDRLRTALFNSISHELRTPLATITGASSSLLESEIEYPEALQRELLETILDGAHRMERVIINLLDTARSESGRLQLKTDWCEAEDIVGTALRRMGSLTQKYGLEIKIKPGLPLFRGDCVLLEQVMVNLLDNAMKYSPAGSSISIDAQKAEGMIRVSVADSGTGIPEEELANIFEKFYRVAYQPASVTGTGLGLSICKTIVEAHGGRIWAENHPSGGARVSFTIPLPSSSVAAEAKEGE